MINTVGKSQLEGLASAQKKIDDLQMLPHAFILRFQVLQTQHMNKKVYILFFVEK